MLNKIEVWGDSIMKGVVLDTLTQKYYRLQENACVCAAARVLGLPCINHARFGMTSEKGLHVMEREAAQNAAGEIAVIGFGGNDIDFDWADITATPTQQHLPHTAPQRYAQNIAAMVQLARTRGMVPVLLSLPPIDGERYLAWVSKDEASRQSILRWLGSPQTIYDRHAHYNDILLRQAHCLGCTVVDVRSAFLAQPDYRALLCADGIHPNEAGHALMQQTLVQYAQQHLPRTA